MDTPAPDVDASADAVEAVVARALERIANGESGVLETLCAEHPRLAPELRERFEALRAMNLIPTDASAMAFPERLGEFRLLRRLGGGGMGVVYEALQEPLGRRVALKLIRPEHLYFERSRERFRRETDAVARLSHPGVVSIYTVGEAQGTPYFAMELIRGATLAQALEQVRGLAPESLLGSDLRAAVLAVAPAGGEPSELESELFAGTWVEACTRIVLRMTEALDHAHSRGVLHRDIKPSNIAVTPDGRVVLLDFGLAGLADELRMTRSGSALGSVLYMAPEQIAGRVHEIDALTDVYALGVTLYELLTLQTPYAASDSEQTRAQILDGQAPPIRARHRNVPRDLEIVCLHAIERERARRYPSMQAFGADLRNVLAGRPIGVRPPSAAYRARRWMARHPTRSATLALSGLLLTVLPSALYWQQRRNNLALRELLDEVTQARELATEESNRAHAAASEAEQSARFLVELFGASDPYSSGRRDLTAREMLDVGVQRVERELAGQPELQARLFERIGLSYNNLDLYGQALAPLERAVELQLRLHGEQDARTAGALVLLGSAQRLADRPEATETLRRANAILAQHPPDDISVQVNAETLLALCLIDGGAADEPLALLSRAHERLDELEYEDRALRWMVSTVLATTHERLGHHADAERVARATLEFDREGTTIANPWRAAALNTLASALRAQGKALEARELCERTLREAREFYQPGNPTLALMESDFALVLLDLGELEPALELLERSSAAVQNELGFANIKAQRVLLLLVDALLRAQRAPRALELLGPALESFAAQGDDGVRSAPFRFRMGLAQLASGARELALQWMRGCDPRLVDSTPAGRASVELALARALVASVDTCAEAGQIAARWTATPESDLAAAAHALAARAAWAQGEFELADQSARTALELHRGLGLRSWASIESRIVLADVALRRASDPQACAELSTALQELVRELGASHTDVASVREQLAAGAASRGCLEAASAASER